MRRDAVISDCGAYRYLLSREWDGELPKVLFVMLNPSTADAEVDDATIRSCIRLSREYGYGGFEVVNLYAFRATDPKDLERARHPVGPENDAMISAAAGRCAVPICAWGAHKMARKRAGYVRQLLANAACETVSCLGTTKAGAPKHPLYIKSGTPLTAYAG